MEWIEAWKRLPEKDGIYLCQIEDHYGIFQFEDGKFHPNDWSDYVGYNFQSSFFGDEKNIIHWMELPKFRELTDLDKIELKVKNGRKRKKIIRKAI